MTRVAEVSVPVTQRDSRRWAGGAAAATVVAAAAFALPHVLGWDVAENGVHPILATWMPRIGPGTVPAVAIAALTLGYAHRWIEKVRTAALLGTAYAVGLAWLVSLACVDGSAGLDRVLGRSTDYLPTARGVTDLGAVLHSFVARIPASAPDNWPVNVAGHPPGLLLFFVGLVRVGLGGDLSAALVVVALAATIPLAGFVAVRALAGDLPARRALPFLTIGPAAIWLAVSADAVIATIVAWGIAVLAVGAGQASRTSATAAAAAGGVILGVALFLSYGMVLVAPIAVAVVAAGRRRHAARVLCAAAIGAGCVVLATAVAGFAWWDAYPVLRDRYWAGVAHLRPAAYWSWADLGALAVSAGPAVGVAVTRVWSRASRDARATRLIVGATVLAVVTADLSQMSRGEVERIWLPFVPWLLIGCGLFGARDRRLILGLQCVSALLVASLLHTRW